MAPRNIATTAELIQRYDGRAPRYTSYPTAVQFGTGVDGELYQSWLAALPADASCGLYIHVPFCDRLCWYCGCHTTVVNKRAPVSEYVSTLLAEIALVRDAAGPRTVSAIHLGGGTPNMLAPEDMDRLFGALRAAFDIAPDAEIAAEIDPRTLTPEWVAAAARAGMNRCSIGVQDIDPAVQKAINRVQPIGMTERAVGLLRQAGIASINMDLIYGLPHQTIGTIRDTVRAIAALEPDRIALFGYAHVPWMKPAQKLLPEDRLPGADDRFAQQDAAASELVAAGYDRIGLDHFARAGDPLARALREGRAFRDFQGYTTHRYDALIGLGASSISRLPQGYAQNAPGTPVWRAAIEAGHLPVARGVGLSDEDRGRAALIERLMCDLEADLDGIACSADLRRSLDGELPRLGRFAADGLVELDGRRIRVTERGRPFVRSICTVFDAYLNTAETRHSRAV